MKARAEHNVFWSIRRPNLFQFFLTFLCIFCITLSINSKEAFATSCFPTPDYFIKNINPKISQPLIGETGAMKILDNTKKELEGYLDYQYMVFSPKWGSEKFGFGLCPFAKAIPIYLNEQLQYLPLVMKTKKNREFFKKCFNRPELFLSEKFNPKKYFLAEIDYFATHINNYGKVQSIYGSDVLNYARSWENINKFIIKQNIKTEVKFDMIDIVDLDPSLKFDIIISEAVFEHCKDFKAVAKVLSSVLKKDGVLYSSYGGPMWYTCGGDHFSGRDKIENGYNHLLLNKGDYQEYFNKNVRNLEYELNEGGGGGILVENDLFSKLSGNEYMKIFDDEGFESLETIVEFDPVALKLLKDSPEIKKKLISLSLPVNFEDFYLKTHIVYLKKKSN